MSEKINEGSVLDVTLGYIRRDIQEIKKDIKDMKENYVSQTEFRPVKNIVFGFAGLVLTAVITSLVYLVIK